MSHHRSPDLDALARRWWLAFATARSALDVIRPYLGGQELSERRRRSARNATTSLAARRFTGRMGGIVRRLPPQSGRTRPPPVHPVRSKRLPAFRYRQASPRWRPRPPGQQRHQPARRQPRRSAGRRHRAPRFPSRHHTDHTPSTQAVPGASRSQPVTAGSQLKEMPALASDSGS
jgi:hypothetical protein